MESGPVKGPICGVENCRSRIYEEAEDGYLYCQNGHRKGELQRGEDDEDNFSTAARTTTRKKKDDDDVDKGSKHFKGRQAVDLYLKCLQLILRHQLWFLVHEAGLPAELETVVFDLWALRIVQLGDKIVNESQELDTPSQVYSTLDHGEADDKGKERNFREEKLKVLPNLTDCLVLCYLGTLTLRLPVTPGDIYAWVTDGKMAYRRAIKHIPLTMRERLPPTYHAVLDPNTLLKYQRIYATVIDLQVSFEDEYGILWPPLNVPVLLFRYVKELALPIELYDATVQLGSLLGFDFALHTEGQKRFGVRQLPEAHLIGCFIVCVKLLYPFDGERRCPESLSEPTATILDWNEWCNGMNMARTKQKGDSLRLTTEELVTLREKDVFSMLPHQIDQYLDFYADTFLDDAQIQATRDHDDFRNVLYDRFSIDTNEPHPPSHISDGLSHQERLEVVNKISGIARPSVADGSDDGRFLKPGEKYPRYRTEKDLPEHANKFYEEAAKVAGLSMEMLVMAVQFIEAKIERWKRKQRYGRKVE